MRLTRRQKDNLGLSALGSTMALSLSLAALAVHQKSLLAALGALIAAEGAVGCLCLLDPKPRKKRPEEELFDKDECREARAHMRRVLGGRHDEERAPRVLREIPRDEEATEADFQ